MSEKVTFQSEQIAQAEDPRSQERERVHQTVERIISHHAPGQDSPLFVERVQFDLSGTTIDFCAATHVSNTLLIPEHRQKIVEAVDAAKIVILESSSSEEQWFINGQPNPEVVSLDGGFFDTIQQMAADQNKPIMVFDPYTPDTLSISEYANSVGTLAGGFTGAYTAFELVKAYAASKSREVRSRRGALRTIGQIAAFAVVSQQIKSAGYDSTNSLEFRSQITGNEYVRNRREFGFDDQLFLGHDGYRDLVVGQQLALVCSQLKTPTRMAMIGGASHLAGIYRYATTDLGLFESTLKTVPKAIFDQVAVVRPRVYKYNQETKTWIKS